MSRRKGKRDARANELAVLQREIAQLRDELAQSKVPPRRAVSPRRERDVRDVAIWWLTQDIWGDSLLWAHTRPGYPEYDAFQDCLRRVGDLDDESLQKEVDRLKNARDKDRLRRIEVKEIVDQWSRMAHESRRRDRDGRKVDGSGVG
jgi:hypothetical protein